MLKLDEKQIRKGKPIGLPYVGSKKKISKKIVEIIKQNFGTDKPVYDIFGGGGAITAELMLNGLEVHYNDLDKTITDMFQRVISQDREWIKTLIVSREEFIQIIDKQDKTIDDELKLLVNSFGNNRKNYLYSKDASDLKYDLAVDIIKNHDTFSGHKKTETYLQCVKKKERELGFENKAEKGNVLEKLQRLQQLNQLERLQQIEQLGRLQQLERLQQIEQLGRLERLQPANAIKATNFDYNYFSNIKGAILYLDPPYENTSQKAYINSFDSSAFYDWAFSMAKNNIVLISSYEISDDRFKSVYEFKTARSTLQGGSNGSRTEKLFMVQ